MKKIFTCFLLYGMLFVMMSSCQQNQSNSSSLDFSVVSSVSDELSLPKSGSAITEDNYDEMIYFAGINVPVTFTPEVKVTNIYIDGYWLNFNYEVGNLQGKSNIPLTYGRLKDVNWRKENFFKSISLMFNYDEGRASLNVNWVGWKSGNIYTESEDTYVLDEKSNLWYRQWENFDISPVILTQKEATFLFPDNPPKENKDYTTFISIKPIYDVSFYRVSNDDIGRKEFGPDILLAHYDEYTNDDLFFWQTDSMYMWHLSIQYKDGNGNSHIFYYTVHNFASEDPTIMFEIDSPDWNTEVGGEVYIEE